VKARCFRNPLSEYRTGKTHGGRIDTLGIDENGSPVIIEYKRAMNENVINQGLYYLDWFLDHRGEFELIVLKTLGKESADGIEWGGPRLLCIAGDFTRYDEHAVGQIGRNIELIRYQKFGGDHLLLDLVNAASSGGQTPATAQKKIGKNSSGGIGKNIEERLAQANEDTRDLYASLDSYLLALGDDVQPKTLKHYFAYRRIKNFACVEVFSDKVLAFVKVNPDNVTLEEGFTQDVRKVGHFGTGDLKITLKTPADLDKAIPLLAKSYEVS
jgi:predicted transport protein